MKIVKISIHPYQIALSSGQIREGGVLEIENEEGDCGWGEAAPFPQRNLETFKEVFFQLQGKKKELLQKEWVVETCLQQLSDFFLYPSLHFGLESALLSLLNPLPDCEVECSALFMGSCQEIFKQASERYTEGFTVAKLKVGNLSFEDAFYLINELKKPFRLRIDVGQAWKTIDALRFFARFSEEDFEYVEDPFQNPLDLAQFTHPFAVEEPFPKILSLEQLETLPKLRALVFKPTVQGGLSSLLSLLSWANKHKVALVLSSNFESGLGLACIASIACRLSPYTNSAVGIGTYHHIKEPFLSFPLSFQRGKLQLSSRREGKRGGFRGIDCHQVGEFKNFPTIPTPLPSIKKL